MKHLKAKLMAAISMLLVATVMLTSASFAWFSISTNPEVTNISASLSGNGNLEVALANRNQAEPTATQQDASDSGKNERWGNMIDLYQFFNVGDKIKLKPAEIYIDNTTSAVTGFTPLFGLDGRVKDTTVIHAVNVADGPEGAAFRDLGGVYAWVPQNVTSIDSNNRSQVYAFEIDFWVRTNYDNGTTPQLTLIQDSGTARDSSTDSQSDPGLGSYITTTALQLALIDNQTTYFLKLGDNVGTDADPKYPLSIVNKDGGDATISLPANKAKLLKLLVYENGGDVGGIALEDEDFNMNIQFKLDGVTLTSMDFPEEGNGRTTSS